MQRSGALLWDTWEYFVWVSPEVYWRAVQSAQCKLNEATRSVVHKCVMLLRFYCIYSKASLWAAWGSRRLEKQLHCGKRRKTDNMTLDAHRQRIVQKLSVWKVVSIPGFNYYVRSQTDIRLQKSGLTYEPAEAKDLERLFFKLILTSYPTVSLTGRPQTVFLMPLRYPGVCCLVSSWHWRIARFCLCPVSQMQTLYWCSLNPRNVANGTTFLLYTKLAAYV